MDAKKVFIGALIACVLVVALAFGVSFLLKPVGPDLGSIHTTEAEIEATEPETEQTIVLTQAQTEPETEAESTRAESKPRETSAPLPQYKLHTSPMVFENGNVILEIPRISGMEDAVLQEKVNQNLSGNASAIISLYPVNVQTDRLEVKCTLNYLDRRRVSVVYTGTLYRPKQQEAERLPAPAETVPAADTQEGSGQPQLAPGETWGVLPGTAPQLPENLQETDLAPGERMPEQTVLPENVQGTNAPQPESSAAAPPQPMETGAVSFNMPDLSGGDWTATRIFYTNTIDLRTASSMSLRDFISPQTLGGYILTEDCQYEPIDATLKSYVRTYLSAHDAAYYASVFEYADFPLKTNSWPQSFCYEHKGDIVFSVPLSNELGDYVLMRFVPETK